MCSPDVQYGISYHVRPTYRGCSCPNSCSWTGEASLVYVGWLGSLQLLRACAIQYHVFNSANGDTENTQWLPSDCSRFAVVCLCWCTTRTNFTGIGSTGVVPKPRPPIPVLRLDPAGPFSAAPCHVVGGYIAYSLPNQDCMTEWG